MASAFPIALKVDNQAIWQNCTKKFYTICLAWRLYITLSFKTGLQIRAVFPSTKPKQFYKGAPFPATASAYLCKYGGCKKNDSSL